MGGLKGSANNTALYNTILLGLALALTPRAADTPLYPMNNNIRVEAVRAFCTQRPLLFLHCLKEEKKENVKESAATVVNLSGVN